MTFHIHHTKAQTIIWKILFIENPCLFMCPFVCHKKKGANKEIKPELLVSSIILKGLSYPPNPSRNLVPQMCAECGQPFKGSWTNIRDIEVLPFSHRQTLSVFNGTLLGLGRIYLSDFDSDFCLQNSCTGKHNKDKHYLFSIELSWAEFMFPIWIQIKYLLLFSRKHYREWVCKSTEDAKPSGKLNSKKFWPGMLQIENNGPQI